MTISIDILETGTVAIRPSHRTQSASRPVLLRRARVLTDRRWTAPLPINTYLIRHPEGAILVDSGESPHVSQRGFFPFWQPFFHVAVDLQVGPEEGIRSRLAEYGLVPSDLTAVILTHLHHDHGDGIPDLGGAPIYVSAEQWEANRRYIPATIEGAVPKRWPHDFTPRILQPSGPPVGPFTRSYPITSDGTVFAVDTPGHVPGHLSVIALDDDVAYFFGGDSTYDQELLDAELTDGVNSAPRQAIESLRAIKEFARTRPTVILPAHDPRAGERLATKAVYHPSPRKAAP
ncbi:N-acyl homoserine lactonase family protein [Gordonia sp. NPDC003376]